MKPSAKISKIMNCFLRINKTILTRIIVLVLVLILALALRVFRIDRVPASLYLDEIDIAYQGRSLVETGKDYRGENKIVYLHSNNAERAPLLGYLSALGYLLFRQPELQVRMPMAMAGVLVVLLAFALVYGWTKSYWLSLTTALLFSISPWQIQFSRIAFEAITVGAVYVLGLVVFYRWLETKGVGLLFLAVFLISASVYTYKTMSLYAPFSLLILLIIYHKNIFAVGLRNLLLATLIALGTMVPFIYSTTIGAPDQARFNQISIFSDPMIPIWVMRNREIDSGDLISPEIGKKPVWYSSLFHNKLNSYVELLGRNYLKLFSTEFLFLDGDPNWRHSIGKFGELYVIEILPLAMGVAWLVVNSKKKWCQFLLLWLFTSPLAAALTSDGGFHASRSFMTSIPILIAISFGWWSFLHFLKKRSEPWQKLVIIVIVFAYGISFCFYYHKYLVHYPIESARSFGYGFKEAVKSIGEIENKYRKIVMVDTNDPAPVYFIFWNGISAKTVQNFGVDFNESKNDGSVLGKIQSVTWSNYIKDKDENDFFEPNTLYLLTGSEIKRDGNNKPNIPIGGRLIKEIFYPDKSIAFYLVEGVTK